MVTCKNSLSSMGSLTASASCMVFVAITGIVIAICNGQDSVSQCENRPDATRSIRTSQRATEMLVNTWNDPSFLKELNRTSECERDVERAILGYLGDELWALQLWDAWAKPGPSLLKGRSKFVGNLYQCRQVKSPPCGKNKTPGFKGNYCIVVLSNLTTLNKMDRIKESELHALGYIEIGTCMPDTCSETDIQNIFQNRLRAFNMTTLLNVKNVECRSDRPKSNTFTVMAMIIVFVFGALMIVGTALDVIFIQWLRWEESQDKKDPTVEDRDTNTQPGDQPMTHLSKTATVSSAGETNPARLSSKQKGLLFKVLISFSVHTNTKKLMNVKQSPGSVSAISGLRVFAAAWVTMTHMYYMTYPYYANFLSGTVTFLNLRMADPIIQVTLAIDLFVAISGVVAAFSISKQVLQQGWTFNWVYFYLHRYWRLTPCLMVTIILVNGFLHHFTYGPTYPVNNIDISVCENNWWANLVHFTNFMDINMMCTPTTWTVAAVFQMYLIIPLLLLPFYIHKRIGIAVCVGSIVLMSVLNFALSYHYDWPIGNLGLPVMQRMLWHTNTYLMPYTKMPTFIVGICTGHLLVVKNGKVQMNSFLVAFGWIVAISAALFLMFGFHDDIAGNSRSGPLQAATYWSQGSILMGACGCWVIVACASGYGGPVNAFLSWSPFVIMDRLGYSYSLVHHAVIYYLMRNMEQRVILNGVNLIVYFTATTVVTYMVAFVLVLAIESPLAELEKVLFRKTKQS